MADACSKCRGCGQIADDDDGTPWTFWAELKFPENMSIVAGLVKPIPCPSCKGTGGRIAADKGNRVNAIVGQILAIAGGAMTVPIADIQDVLQDIDAQHTVMPILDPTKYRAVATDLSDNQELIQAFYNFRRELEKLKIRAQERKQKSAAWEQGA